MFFPSTGSLANKLAPACKEIAKEMEKTDSRGSDKRAYRVFLVEQRVPLILCVPDARLPAAWGVGRGPL
jgi:hypothetical protein